MIQITATTIEDFSKMADVAKALGFNEDNIINVYRGALGYIKIDVCAFIKAVWISKELDIDNVSFKLGKDFREYGADECFVIETTGKYNDETVVIKTYCEKNERPFVKSLSKASH